MKRCKVEKEKGEKEGGRCGKLKEKVKGLG